MSKSIISEIEELVRYHASVRGVAADAVVVKPSVYAALLAECLQIGHPAIPSLGGTPYGLIAINGIMVYEDPGLNSYPFDMCAGRNGDTYESTVHLPVLSASPKHPAAPVCECGALKCGHPAHSDWCPIYKPHGYQSRA